MRHFIFALLLLTPSTYAQDDFRPETVRKRAESIMVPYAKELAALPVVIAAVKLANAKQKIKMDNALWKRTSVEDPIVQDLSNNVVATELKNKKVGYVSEVFISAADGTKVAFIEKTTSWNHSGKPKHDLPMHGKVWIGKLELDNSSGVNQIQVSVPVLDNGRPIGSIVIGAAATKL